MVISQVQISTILAKSPYDAWQFLYDFIVIFKKSH